MPDIYDAWTRGIEKFARRMTDKILNIKNCPECGFKLLTVAMNKYVEQLVKINAADIYRIDVCPNCLNTYIIFEKEEAGTIIKFGSITNEMKSILLTAGVIKE